MAPPKKKGVKMDLDEFLGDWAEEDTGPQNSQWNQQSTDLFASVGLATSAATEVQLPTTGPFTARVGNLVYECTEEDIKMFFSKQRVQQIRMPRGPDQKSRGLAFVEFEDRDSLASALALDGSNLGGRAARIGLEQPAGEYGNRGPRRFEDDLDWSSGARRAPAHAPREPRMGGGGSGGFRGGFEEPELNWGARRTPAQAPREPRSFGGRPPRGPPSGGFDEPELDWGSRRAPTQAPRETRSFNRGGPRNSGPRESKPEPELNWDTRRAPANASGKKIGKPSGFSVLKGSEEEQEEPKAKNEEPSTPAAPQEKAAAPKMAETIAAANASASAQGDESWTTVKR